MSQRVAHRSELPEWFDLHKYEAARSLDFAGWYEQLFIRRDLLLLLRPPEHDVSMYLSEHLTQLREKPIVDVKDYPFSESTRLWACEDAKSPTPKYAYGISTLRVRDLLGIENSMSEERRTYARGWWEYVTTWDPDPELEEPPPVAYEHQPWLDEAVSESREGAYLSDSEMIVVQLDLPDALLIKGFSRFLKQVREKRDCVSSSQRYRTPDLARLLKYSVLPFLDLRMWAMETDTQIPNRVLADAIFEEGEGGEEVVRKTTKKLAEHCLRNLDIFLAEVANEETPTD